MSVESHESMVKPGAGVPMEHLPLNPIKEALAGGTFAFDTGAQQGVEYAHTNIGTITSAERNAILQLAPNKGFRNAYASLIIEKAYPQYEECVAGAGMGLYTLDFDESGRSSLQPIPQDVLEDMTAAEVAVAIAASNQQTLAHFICEELHEDPVPAISGDLDSDKAYFDSFQKQSDLIMRSNRAFQIIPPEAGMPSAFITSGIEVARLYIFGLPNTIRSVSERDGLDLTADQQRNSFKETAAKMIPPYFLPSLPLAVEINRRVLAPDNPQRMVDPAAYTHDGNLNALIVFPRAEIIDEVNASFAETTLPVRTNCPAFHSKVQTTEEPTVTVPLPRSLPDIALQQFDAWYYPKLATEYYQGAR